MPPPPTPPPPPQIIKDEMVAANYARVQEELQLKLKYDEYQNLTFLSIRVLNKFFTFFPEIAHKQLRKQSKKLRKSKRSKKKLIWLEFLTVKMSSESAKLPTTKNQTNAQNGDETSLLPV